LSPAPDRLPQAAMSSPSEALEKADALATTNPAESESLYRSILALDLAAATPDLPKDDTIRLKESAITGLSALFVKASNPAALSDLATSLRPFFTAISKAKGAKIIRALLDALASVPDPDEATLSALCEDTIAWCRAENRTFLRQRIEGRLAALRLSQRHYTDALRIISALISEIKRLDDKGHLLEVQLLESRAHHALRNLPKARASLTAARTTANGIYVPPALQAEIDSQAGIVSAEEKDYKTAYSYFYEAFEGYMKLDSPNAVNNLKYMLLCKIMTDHAEDVAGIVNGAVALKYSGRDIGALQAVAAAYKSRSLLSFERASTEYKTELVDDPIIHTHLTELYEKLLEQNLLRLVEPFSRVEISHIAELIKLPLETVEAKLSQMILDKKLHGILDQGAGCLEVFDEVTESKTYKDSLQAMTNMGFVVDSLFEKASALR